MSSLTPPVGSTKEYIPHPAGTCPAVLADVFVQVQENPFYGKVSKFNGKVDENPTRTRVSLVFLTDKLLPADSQGVQRPMQLNQWFKFGWGTVEYPSDLRNFVKAWFPTATDAQIEKTDLNKLIGRGAYLSVSHKVKDGKTYVNAFAMPLPQGMIAPRIPADFQRREQRQAAQAPPPPPPQAMAAPPAPPAPVPAAPRPPVPGEVGAIGMPENWPPVSPQGEDDLPF